MSTAKAAEWLGITPRTLYTFIDTDQLPAFRFGRVIRLKQNDIEDFVETHRVHPGEIRHLYPGPDDD
jgi:excisionase family DNA binding protein